MVCYSTWPSKCWWPPKCRFCFDEPYWSQNWIFKNRNTFKSFL